MAVAGLTVAVLWGGSAAGADAARAGQQEPVTVVRVSDAGGWFDARPAVTDALANDLRMEVVDARTTDDWERLRQRIIAGRLDGEVWIVSAAAPTAPPEVTPTTTAPAPSITEPPPTTTAPTSSTTEPTPTSSMVPATSTTERGGEASTRGLQSGAAAPTSTTSTLPDEPSGAGAVPEPVALCDGGARTALEGGRIRQVREALARQRSALLGGSADQLPVLCDEAAWDGRVGRRLQSATRLDPQSVAWDRNGEYLMALPATMTVQDLRAVEVPEGVVATAAADGRAIKLAADPETGTRGGPFQLEPDLVWEGTRPVAPVTGVSFRASPVSLNLPPWEPPVEPSSAWPPLALGLGLGLALGLAVGLLVAAAAPAGWPVSTRGRRSEDRALVERARAESRVHSRSAAPAVAPTLPPVTPTPVPPEGAADGAPEDHEPPGPSTLDDQLLVDEPAPAFSEPVSTTALWWSDHPSGVPAPSPTTAWWVPERSDRTELWAPDEGDVAMAVYTEKQAGLGEDAPPTYALRRAAGRRRLRSRLLAVYDGLGGSGSAKVPLVGGDERSQAYLASRYVRAAVEQWYGALDGDAIEAAAAGALQAHISATLAALAARLPKRDSKVRSRSARVLPTTIAGVLVEPVDGDRRHARVAAFWAGDSRSYLLTPSAGLQLLTADHTNNPDVMEQLTNEGPMTNVVSASAEWVLSITQPVEVELPFVVLCGTDGLHGYVQSPSGVERNLLDLLEGAEDAGAWARSVAAWLGATAGDDATLAVAAVGQHKFADLRKSFRERAEVVRQMEDETFAGIDPTDRVAVSAARDRLWAIYAPFFVERMPR